MVPKLNRRGSSFRGVARYLFHDKDHADSAMRVAWSETLNCWSESPADAWFEMWDTYKERDGLKAAAGLDRRGRQSDKPVLHYSLAWHPDERPDQAQMKAAARSSLKAMGLEDHQVIIVAHNDEKHPHVHLVVNTIHPHTGKSAGLDYSKEALSKWAQEYEQEHGGVRCEQRVRNNEDRAFVKKLRAEEKLQADFAQAQGQAPPAAAPYKPIKDRSPSRPEAIDKAELVQRMRSLRASMKFDHDLERGVTWARHRAEAMTIEANTKLAVENVREHGRAYFKPKWSTLYRDQKGEQRHVRKVATHPFERAMFVFANADRLALPGRKLSFRDKLGLIVSPGRLEKRLAVTHERERQNLARQQKTEGKGLTDRIWSVHKEKMHTLRDRQQTERAAEKAHHTAEREAVTFSSVKAEILKERAPSAAPEFQQAKAPESTPGAAPLSREEAIQRSKEEFRALLRNKPDREREP